MEFERLVLFLAVVFSVLGHVSSELGADCSVSSGCTNSPNYVCDPADNIRKVKADGMATDCNSTDVNCPTNAHCNVDTCSCNSGYSHKYSTGLCTVLGTDCSQVACGDLTNYVCDNMGFTLYKVKADGIATGCEGSDSNCPSDAVCTNDTCRCRTGYKEDAGLCKPILGTICAKDSDCKSLLTNSYCGVISPCKTGTCACSEGYSGPDCQLLGYGKRCQTGNDKCDAYYNGLTCDPTSRQCVCSRREQTYKIQVSHCTDKNLLGEKCTNLTDCYLGSNQHGACTDSKCTCAEGFIEEKRMPGLQACRPPHAGEKACASTCGMFPSVFLRGDTSQVAPTCTSNKCSCAASGVSMYSANLRSLCISYCLTDLASGEQERDVGANCTALNQCKSKFCGQCPGDAHGMCYEAPCEKAISDGVRLKENVMTLCISIVLYLYLYSLGHQCS